MRCINILLIGTKGRKEAEWWETKMASKSCAQFLTGLVISDSARALSARRICWFVPASSAK